MPRFEPHPKRRPAIVAGASSGIGAATAIELAAHGFPVALGARRVEKCQEFVEKIRADGGEAVALPLDVTDPESVKGFVHRATEELGHIELLVAGAGDTYFGRLHEISTDSFEAQVQIHLIGANRLATAVVGGDGGAATGRPHLRRLRRRAAPAPAHGCLRRREGSADGDGDQPADGARGHRRPGVDRSSRADEDEHGLEPAGRIDRTRARGLGQVGAGPPRLLPAGSRSRPGHHIRRRDAARWLRREHGAAARGAAGERTEGTPATHTRRRGDAGQ